MLNKHKVHWVIFDIECVNVFSKDPEHTALPTSSSSGRLETSSQGVTLHQSGRFLRASKISWFVGLLREVGHQCPCSTPRRELHAKAIGPNSLISPRLSVLAMVWSWSLYFCQQVLVHVGRAIVKLSHYTIDGRRSLLSRVRRMTLCTWTTSHASVSTHNKSNATARVAGLALYPATAARSKEERIYGPLI